MWTKSRRTTNVEPAYTVFLLCTHKWRIRADDARSGDREWAIKIRKRAESNVLARAARCSFIIVIFFLFLFLTTRPYTKGYLSFMITFRGFIVAFASTRVRISMQPSNGIVGFFYFVVRVHVRLSSILFVALIYTSTSTYGYSVEAPTSLSSASAFLFNSSVPPPEYMSYVHHWDVFFTSNPRERRSRGFVAVFSLNLSRYLVYIVIILLPNSLPPRPRTRCAVSMRHLHARFGGKMVRGIKCSETSTTTFNCATRHRYGTSRPSDSFHRHFLLLLGYFDSRALLLSFRVIDRISVLLTSCHRIAVRVLSVAPLSLRWLFLFARRRCLRVVPNVFELF